MCLNEIIRWIVDNVDRFIQQSVNETPEKHTGGNDGVEKSNFPDVSFSRLWIYSHHIYNKAKRKAILDLAAEMDLTGFSIPGKPGIICVEGCRDDADTFWQRIRGMQWQKIVLKHRDDQVAHDDVTFTGLRCFEQFEEKFFEPRPCKGRGAHMDRGLLYQFLLQKGFAHIFPMYFGVEGKEPRREDD